MIELFLNQPNKMEIRVSESISIHDPNEVKIKLLYGGICGSDLLVYQGKLGHAAYPLRPGHELLGHVIEAGEQSPYRVGTRVVVQPNTYCGECRLCLSGKTNICKEKKSLGVNMNGGFSEEFVISSKYVLPVPDDLSDRRAVLIEPFAVIVHAFKKVHIGKDTKVAIIGCGNEGMLAAALANHLDANVTAMDINMEKFDLIRSLGSFRVIHPDEVGDEKYEVVVEAAGSRKAIELAAQITAPGGDLVMIGMIPEATLPITHLVRSEITLHGSIIYNVPEDFEKAMEYLRRSDFHIDPVVSTIIPFWEFNQAYELALSRNVGKVVMSFGGRNNEASV
ncbi:zinc-dependent alcohol dehydrogenase [Paenibacillus aestuarii]|uniref:Zinc-binding dehydrogenase n=1 Tax=Paenibacillus aestuarii TaxID=516965 RepID=A0ABW0K876_9BACL|nr:alcohol dehydrogenase catalytic domain-containing protein [Paenibacillus aestuarii]